MKRSQLARKTPLTARKPMKRAHKKRIESHKKDCRWRSKRYLAFVRSLPCCFCAQPADDAHHIIGIGYGLSGMGLTAPDSYAMSLCRPHHAAVHASPDLQQQQPDWLRCTIRRGLEAFSDVETRQELTNALALIEAKSEVMA